MFNPDLRMRLVIGGERYTFLPHPVVTDEVNKIVRPQAVTYQIQKETDLSLWALKVPNPGYVSHQVEQVTAMIRPYGHMPGLYVANRVCLTASTFPDAVNMYPQLAYSILMPWITGTSWAGFMDDETISTKYTERQARELALTTAFVLWNLERHGLAHADIAGDNLIVMGSRRIELIDLENFFISGRPLLSSPSRGWRGYQHPRLDTRGQSRPEGDRFAGAILLTEMLTWWNPLVRALTEGESLFQLQELEAPDSIARRVQAIRQTLRGIYPGLQALFDQAWQSQDLAQCPDFQAWTLCLLHARWNS